MVNVAVRLKKNCVTHVFFTVIFDDEDGYQAFTNSMCLFNLETLTVLLFVLLAVLLYYYFPDYISLLLIL